MDNRTNWVDYTKAIGIILVVYGHVARGLYNAGIDIPESIYLLADSIVYSFHMPLFFFLSGLFFYQSFNKKGGRQLVLSKVDTIFYPYLIWSLFQGSIEVFLSNFTTGSVSWAEVFDLLANPRGQFWFLITLFAIFLTISIVFSTKAIKHSKLVFAAAALLYLYPKVLPSVPVLQLLAQNLVYFCFGIVFMKDVNIDKISSFKALFAGAVLFVSGQWLFQGYFFDNDLVELILALISIVFIVSASNKLAQKPYKFIVFIGSSSMAIYLMHILASSGTRVILSGVFNIDNYATHLIVACLVGLIGPLIAVKIIERFNIPFVFSAPISQILRGAWRKIPKPRLI